MNDSMIFLSVALVACGVYIVHLHSLLGRYRKWSREASALLMSISMRATMEEYGFDLEPRREDEEA